MTLHATRAGQKVTVHANCGIELTIDGGKYCSVGITEDASHIRHFWGELGRLLDAADQEASAAAENDSGGLPAGHPHSRTGTHHVHGTEGGGVADAPH